MTKDSGGHVSFTNQNVSGPINVKEAENALTFSRGGVSATDEISLPAGKPALTLDLGTVNQLIATGNYSTTAPATSGEPRLWLNFGESTTAKLTVNEVAHGSAFGFIGSKIESIILEGSVTKEAGKEWGQLQIWDKGADNAALKNLVLNMSSATDLGAYHPHGILTKPTAIDGSGSTGALKITPSGFPSLSWTSVKTGAGNDVLEFSGEQVNGTLTIDAGAGDDTITFGVNTTVTGGAGNDTFVITAPAGEGQPTKQLIITDYGNGHDVIDLTEVTDLKLNGSDGDRLEIHQGGQTGPGWGDDAQGTTNDILVQLSGGSGSQLIVQGAFATKKTIEFKLTQKQIGLNPTADQDEKVDFLVNITDEGTIDASGDQYNGAILSGGGGKQTLLGSEGDDIMQGGGGADTFTGGAGNDIFVIKTDKVSEAEADIVNDFMIGNNRLVFKFGATVDFIKASAGVTDFAAALAAANSAIVDMTHDVRVNAQAVENDLWVFADTNGDNSVDAVVKLAGVKLDNFSSIHLLGDGPA